MGNSTFHRFVKLLGVENAFSKGFANELNVFVIIAPRQLAFQILPARAYCANPSSKTLGAT